MKQSAKQLGFSLVELVVSLAVFSVVVTIAVGSLLVLINANQQIQAEQSVLTNLSFALDSMTREIRTGTNYHCVSRPNYTAGGGEAVFDNSDNHEDVANSGTGTQDCPNGSSQPLRGISFLETGDSITGGASERILYFYDNIPSSDNYRKLMRRVGNGDAQSVVSSGIVITDADFFVTGSDKGGGNQVQPAVTIVLKAQDKADATGKVYKIQTTVTQRTLDL